MTNNILHEISENGMPDATKIFENDIWGSMPAESGIHAGTPSLVVQAAVAFL